LSIFAHISGTWVPIFETYHPKYPFKTPPPTFIAIHSLISSRILTGAEKTVKFLTETTARKSKKKRFIYTRRERFWHGETK
jgi:hypothetical protein